MHMALAAAPYSPADAPHAVPARLSVAEYHALIEAGLLPEDNSLELLDGVLVPKMSKRPSHSTATERTRRVLTRLLAPGWHVRVQEPITLAAGEPEPDVCVARGDFEDYEARHPLPGEVALIVEVADSTLTRDREHKGRLYAEAGIPCYWILNLSDQTVEVYQDPAGTGPEAAYLQRTDYHGTQTIPVAAIPALVPPDPSARSLLQG